MDTYNLSFVVNLLVTCVLAYLPARYLARRADPHDSAGRKLAYFLLIMLVVGSGGALSGGTIGSWFLGETYGEYYGPIAGWVGGLYGGGVGSVMGALIAVLVGWPR